MSYSTVAQEPFAIREGLTGTPGSTVSHPFIDGMVGGQAVVTAFESLAQRDDGGSPQWFLVTYPDVAHFAGVDHPATVAISDESQARQWVSFIAALCAKATTAVSS
ncbi:hypothetical protein MANY_30890 [Mycolicibacterium anyangense]|uniref:Dienelactone hydrolase domain-containing protein n=1 Tax=Mycolicibacterium anyangense TaxID=1431246 RepID=A0A6N4WCH6_9MYCO|nr:hypothetical protein [Mycolicibacterium anyangense]BBZ77752.1 hypothetical protein MANY_30890 [Mycolicibacterium anyangense]